MSKHEAGARTSSGETSETWFLEVLLWVLKENVVTESVRVIRSVLESLDEATEERKSDVAAVWENVLKRDLRERRRERRIGMGRNNYSVFSFLCSGSQRDNNSSWHQRQ